MSDDLPTKIGEYVEDVTNDIENRPIEATAIFFLMVVPWIVGVITLLAWPIMWLQR